MYLKGHARIQRGGRGLDPPPLLKNYKNVGLSSNTGPDPLKIYKATKPAFNVGSSSTRQRNVINLIKKIVVKVGPPLTELSGSAHEGHQVVFSKLWCISVREGCFNLSKQCRP